MRFFFESDMSMIVKAIQKRNKMSKKSKIQWLVGDGVLPTQRAPDGCFELRSPLEFVLSPGVKKTIGLGYKCNHAVHVFPAWEPSKKGLGLVDGIWAAQDANPEQDLQVTVINNSSEKIFVNRGDILARCAVFSNQNFEPEYI